jgi:predicted amidohydrolase YtcJ
VTVDLVIVGRIATLAGDEADDLGIVEAIAIDKGRVLLAGTRAAIDELAGPATRRLALGPDEAVIPGLTDGHLHLADAAVAAVQLELETAPTLDVGLARIRTAHEALDDPEAWLRGGGWDAGRWGAWPTAAALEATVPGRRVVLWSHDLHAVWVSPAALTAAGVSAATPEPTGGIVRRLADGTPEGVLHEDATGLVTAHAPTLDGERLADLIERYCRRLLSFGVVAAHEPGELESDVRLEHGFTAIRRLAEAGRLPIRVHAGIRKGALELAIARGLRSGDPLGPPDGRARMGWLKLFGDGTLGSRTAAIFAPYLDEPARGAPPAGPLGTFVTEPAEMSALAETAARAGIATQIHAIGDRSLRAALDALEPTVGRTALRPRVEHVQLVDGADLPRFGRSGIVASVQPADLRDDAAKARRAWGPRSERSYPWGRLLGSGATLAFGTDAPAADDDPWPALAMAVRRRDPSWSPDVPSFGPTEAITLPQALRAACVGAATAAAETDRGRLTPGQRADFLVIPAVALADPEVLRTARPRRVFMDGAVVHEARG